MSLSYPDDRRYHPEHLWAQSRSDGSVLVGISDYAQDQLGAVIFVELPETGAHFTQGQSCASIESAKVTSDAVMPLSGTVLEINEALADTPELLNPEPLRRGLAGARQSRRSRRAGPDQRGGLRRSNGLTPFSCSLRRPQWAGQFRSGCRGRFFVRKQYF